MCKRLNLGLIQTHEEFATTKDSDFKGIKHHKVYLSPIGPCGRIVPVTNSDFLIMPTIGQIRAGHLLLVPDYHVEAFSDLDDAQLDIVEEIMKQIVEFNDNVFNQKTIFFEHGCSSSRGIFGPASITHAHLHSLPFDEVEGEDMLSLLKNDKNNEIHEISSLKELRVAFEKNKESYVLFIDTDGKKYMILPKDKWPSQYMRRVSGLAVGNLNYDWKGITEPEPDVIKLANFVWYYAYWIGLFAV